MKISCVWEHNGNDSILYADSFPGAFTRGASKEEAMLKMPEEVADAEAFAQGDEPLVIEAAPITESIEAPKNEITLSELLARFDPSDILTANNGVMPRTNAECAEIAKKLEGEGK